MKAKIFVFFYTSTKLENEKEAKILVLSNNKDQLEVINMDLDSSSASGSLQQITNKMLLDTGIDFDTSPVLVDIILNGDKEEEKELDIYYASYFPANRLSYLDTEKVTAHDISEYTNHTMIRKFLCSI